MMDLRWHGLSTLNLILFMLSFLFFLSFFPLTSEASNEHDHLAMLPLPENFLQEKEWILQNMTLGDFVKDNSEESKRKIGLLLDKLLKIKGPQVGLVLKSTDWPSLSLQNLFEKTVKSDETDEKFLSLFGFGSASEERLLNLSKETIQDFYQEIDSFRSNILLKAPGAVYKHIFQDYFQKDSLENRRILGLSVSSKFFEFDQSWKLAELSFLAKESGSQLKLFYSIPRSHLLADIAGVPGKGSIVQHLETIKRYKKIDLLHGFDITGSIRENDKQSINEEALLQELNGLLDFASKEKVHVRLHAFEGTNKGPFYRALRQVLEQFPSSLSLEIGHFNQLDQEWIHFFSKLRQEKKGRIFVSFDINLASNLALQESADFKEITKRLLLASQERLDLRLGSDGRGILPGASFTEQLAQIRTVLPQFYQQREKFLRKEEKLKKTKTQIEDLDDRDKENSLQIPDGAEDYSVMCFPRQKKRVSLALPDNFIGPMRNILSTLPPRMN